MVKNVLAFSLVLTLALGCVGCEKKTTADKAGDAAKQAEKTGGAAAIQAEKDAGAAAQDAQKAVPETPK